MAIRELQPPHFPATYGQRGAAPLTGRPLPPTGQKGRGGDAFARPSPDLRGATGSLPPLATYALTPTPADRGLRTGGLPHSPTDRLAKGATPHGPPTPSH